MVLEWGGGWGGKQGSIFLACFSSCLTHHHWHPWQAGRSEVEGLFGCRQECKWLTRALTDSDTLSLRVLLRFPSGFCHHMCTSKYCFVWINLISEASVRNISCWLSGVSNGSICFIILSQGSVVGLCLVNFTLIFCSSVISLCLDICCWRQSHRSERQASETKELQTKRRSASHL